MQLTLRTVGWYGLERSTLPASHVHAGFLLAGSNVNKDDPSAQVLTIGDSATCAENATIDPGNQVAFYPKSDDNPCGFEFPLSADKWVWLQCCSVILQD